MVYVGPEIVTLLETLLTDPPVQWILVSVCGINWICKYYLGEFQASEGQANSNIYVLNTSIISVSKF